MFSLNTGSTLNNSTYKIVRTLGQGSFGITYLASARTTIAGALGKMDVEVNVAIKEFFMSDLNSRSADGTSVEKTDSSLVKNYRTKFRREAENLSKLHHSNIVKVLDVFDENNTTYYVMEYVDGMNLDDYIKQQGRLTVSESLRITKEVCSALSYMHEHKMLHLDLKPKNIMRDRDGHIRLIDFGLSKQYNDSGEPESSTTIGLGTPGYAPTEQANYKQDGTLPVTIDVYALGGTLYKMLTGQTPPEASVVLNQGLPLTLLKQSGISDAIVAIVEKAMCPIIRGRYQSVEELLAAIKHLQSLEPAEMLPQDEDTIISQDLPEKEVQESLLDAEPVPVNSSEVKKKTEIIEESKQKPNVLLNKKSASNHYKDQPKRPAPKFWKYGIVAVVLLIGIAISLWYTWKTPSSEDYSMQSVPQPQVAKETVSSSPANNQASSATQPMPNVQTFTVTGNGKTVSFKMKKVEAGSFQMGSNSGYSDEKPVHRVTISKDYYLGETEVTQDLWVAVMGNNPSIFKGGSNPVERVSYNDCLDFIRKLNQKTGKNFRMPTEAEWEYAARGGNKTNYCTYAGSFNINYVAWYTNNSNGKTHPVAQKNPNELGLYDMSGNVLEWCNDWYDGSYYSSSSQTDPTGPSSGSYRVFRGGGWDDSAERCRSADRHYFTPASRGNELGFRLAL